MVAQVTLDHSVWVRVLVPEPNGAMVKRLRRRPLKAKSGVRFPVALPAKLTPSKNAWSFLFYIINNNVQAQRCKLQKSQDYR